MSRALALVFVVAACAHRAPEPPAEPDPTRFARIPPLTRPTPRAPGLRPGPSLADRIRSRVRPQPTFDPTPYLPDPAAHVLRWPLSATEHPELVPQFEVARALAEPGVDWSALCRRGAHKRSTGGKLREETRYLGAWCAIGNRDTDAALAQLAILTSSVLPGLAPAVRRDVANLLVSHGDARHASALLARHRLMIPDLLDVIAATYVDLGKLDDAYEINELSLAHDPTSATSHCRRRARRIVLRPEPYRLSTAGTARLFGEASGSDPGCRRLENELACWLAPHERCGPHLSDRGIDVGYARVLAASSAWGAARDAKDWADIAQIAIAGAPLPEAVDYATTALENAWIASGCSWSKVTHLTDELRRRGDPLPTEVAARLDALADWRICRELVRASYQER